ncbi:MAG: hypothetical protein M1840_004715 [Geoglossum simile]|nr:MAG: hypothetical protein M1840_004715 [Geoglossum simile]
MTYGQKRPQQMPPDKHCHAGGTGRPLMPTSSAANIAPKAPLTPRIAASSAASASVSPTLRRGARNDAGGTPGGSSKEDLSTPVKAFLNSNVTPRSSSRKARVDSTPSTPNGTPGGTPSGSKPASSIEPLRLADEFVPVGQGFGILASEGKPLSRPASVASEGKQSIISFAPSLPSDRGQYDHGQARSDLGDQELSPRFFYASDVRTPAVGPRHPPLRPAANKKTPNFFYANSVNNMSSAVSPTNLTSPSPASGSQAKLFSTNGPTEPQIGRRALHTHSASSTGSPSALGHVLPTPQQLRSPRLASLNPALQTSEKHRPPSPPKGATSIASLRETPPGRQPIPATHGSSHGQMTFSPREPVPTALFQGRILNDQPRRASHGRSVSVGSIDSSPRSRIGSAVDIVSSSSPVTRLNLAATTTDGTLQKSPEKDKIESSSDLSSAPPKVAASIPQASLKNTPSYNTSQQIDLAANARRERKVLDLEISNSSLLAINRTLEREMRKQCAELRRYRRLSRSGRLSLTSVSNCPPLVRPSDATDYEDRSDRSDMTEEDEESLSDDSFEDGALSPNAMVESDARHRAKDERRLQLDLSKHRQLLIDSQKMNQSLKKCLGWTEELIREGRKALDYRVRVSDIRLGGRVLAPDDLEDSKQNMGLRIPQDSQDDGVASALMTPIEQERDDRDSGVDLE